MRTGRPDLAAIDPPTAINFGRLSLRGKQVGTRAGFAHANCKAQFATANPWQNIFLDVLWRVFQQNRSALQVGDEMKVCRRVGHTELFGHHVPFQLTALVSAVSFGPSHPDPTFGAD